MGNVSVLTNVTLIQLLDEAPVRWPTLWSEEDARMTCLIMMPRKSRPDMEHHGFFVEHTRPIFGLFYRPRDEANVIKSMGFNPLSASFQFLNLAVSDLGLWMQKLTEEQGYEADKVKIEPLPSSVSASLRLGFEAFEITTYRHGSLDQLERLPLVMPPISLVGKAFLSIPDSPSPVLRHTALSGESESNTNEAEFKSDEVGDNTPQPSEDVPEENYTEISAEPEAHTIVNEGAVPITATVNDTMPDAPVVHEIVTEQVELPAEGVEAEFRMIIQRLMGEGLDHNTIMENAEFQEVSDRAQAAGVNTWQLFLRIAT